ncbi:MAG: Cys-tRNA(Pro) deacylase [Wujia sp.]
MAKKEMKTNVMRLLEQAKIPYKHYCYADTDAISGMEVVAALGENPDRVFKTLVTQGKSGAHYVFVIPVNQELDLKKAAEAAHEKSISMLKSKDLLGLTGYIHGGCSPIGMKKTFPTFFHESATQFDTVFFSAGKIGYQVEVVLDDVRKILKYDVRDLTCEQQRG